MRIPWQRIRESGRKLLVIPPIIVAVLLMIWMVKTRSGPQKRTPTEYARALSIIRAPRLDVRPKVEGFGTAKYAQVWRAVAQVPGRLKAVNPELRPGAIFSKGETLFQIDDSDYKDVVEELSNAQGQTTAEIKQLTQKKENFKQTLAIEHKLLLVYERELKRARELFEGDAGSQASVDAKSRSLLAQEQRIQDIKNSKSLLGPQEESLRASLKQTTAKLDQAVRNRERTKVVVPFTRMRIGEVQLEKDQFVGTNEVLFEGYNAAGVEIETQLQADEVRRLINRDVDTSQLPNDGVSMSLMRQLLDVDIRIHNLAGGDKAVWNGKFLRIRESFDAQTRTVGLVAGVNNPLSTNVLEKPPLVQGAYCRVDVYGQRLSGAIVIPSAAIHGNKVYVIDAENRLRQHDVTIAFEQDAYSVVQSGLAEGERVVVSPPSPAIIGMLTTPANDEKSLQDLKEQVGESLLDKQPAISSPPVSDSKNN